MESYRIEFSRSAEKDLRRLDKSSVAKIIQKISELSANPLPTGVKKIVGTLWTYRIRMGDYRAIYEIEDDRLVIFVIRIAHRKDVYR